MDPSQNPNVFHATTICSVRRNGQVVIAGDGQVTLGHTVMKANARKVRRLGKDGRVLAGFAGAWSATLGPGMVRWNIDDQGRISGTRTTGCTYTGQLALRPERKAVVDALVQEDCAGVRIPLEGVATINPDSRSLSMVMTTPDEAQAVVLGLAR